MPTATLEKRTIAPAVMAGCRMVGIGGLEIVRPPERLKTVLGSCVGIVLCDVNRAIAGLAHSILPSGDDTPRELGKYADLAVDHLITLLLAAGAKRESLVAKLVGGARMFGTGVTASLGDRNVESARGRLCLRGMRIAGEEVGGTAGRRVVLDPQSGQVDVEAIGQSAVTL